MTKHIHKTSNQLRTEAMRAIPGVISGIIISSSSSSSKHLPFNLEEFIDRSNIISYSTCDFFQQDKNSKSLFSVIDFWDSLLIVCVGSFQKAT